MVNTLDIDVIVQYPVSFREGTSAQDELTEGDQVFLWKEKLVKSKQIWSLPMGMLDTTKSDLVKVLPVFTDTQQVYHSQVISWNSNSTHKLLSFGNEKFLQVILEKEPISVFMDQYEQIDFAFNILLLPVVTFSNLRALPRSPKMD